MALPHPGVSSLLRRQPTSSSSQPALHHSITRSRRPSPSRRPPPSVSCCCGLTANAVLRLWRAAMVATPLPHLLPSPFQPFHVPPLTTAPTLSSPLCSVQPLDSALAGAFSWLDPRSPARQPRLPTPLLPRQPPHPHTHPPRIRPRLTRTATLHSQRMHTTHPLLFTLVRPPVTPPRPLTPLPLPSPCSFPLCSPSAPASPSTPSSAAPSSPSATAAG